MHCIFDFDNTIATCDVLIICFCFFPKMTAGGAGKEMEKRQDRLQNLPGRPVAGMDLNKKSLDAYLPKIKLDPYFKPIISFC